MACFPHCRFVSCPAQVWDTLEGLPQPVAVLRSPCSSCSSDTVPQSPFPTMHEGTESKGDQVLCKGKVGPLHEASHTEVTTEELLSPCSLVPLLLFCHKLSKGKWDKLVPGAGIHPPQDPPCWVSRARLEEKQRSETNHPGLAYLLILCFMADLGQER